jgi:hypothetical protein
VKKSASVVKVRSAFENGRSVPLCAGARMAAMRSRR